jgi:hypothetical protein
MSELEEMAELVKRSSKKQPSGQWGFIEWVAVKSISFRSVNHPLFREVFDALTLTSLCQCIIHWGLISNV